MAKIVKKKTPTNRIKKVQRREKPKAAKCARCGKPLHGVPKAHPSEIRKMSKSKRRPSRPYGGHLCSHCMRELFREKARR